MNDLMSLGLHRLWKAFAIAVARPRPGERVLDIATGSGDLARALRAAPSPAARSGSPTSTAACSSAAATGCSTPGSRCRRCNATPSGCHFRAGYFDCVTVGFGLRNMTHKDAALAEMARVLKPGGRLVVLEFSKVWKPLERAYDWYSFKVLPWLGDKVAGRRRRLPLPRRSRSGSIPTRPRSRRCCARAGFAEVEVFNLAAGVVAVHRGYRF